MNINNDKLKEGDKMIRTIMFDYGGVLTTKRRSQLFAESLQAQYGVKPEEVIGITDGAQKTWSKGEMSTEEVLSKIQALGVTEDIESLEEKLASFNTIDDNMMALLTELKQNYDICLVTDGLPPFTKAIKRDYAHLFRMAVFSDDEGCLKGEADHRLFDIAFARIGTPPDQCVYVDDREKFLAYPKSVGTTCILFAGEKELRQSLRELDVIC